MPISLRAIGSLVMKENQPSTWPWAIGVGSNPAATLVTFDASMLLALRNAAHTASLTLCTPTFLPIMSCGVLIGLLASDMMQNGFFWYSAPMQTRLKPFWIAAAAASVAETAIRPWPVLTTVSCGVAFGPEAIRLT